MNWEIVGTVIIELMSGEGCEGEGCEEVGGVRLNSLKVSLYDSYPYIHTTPSSTHVYQPSQFNPKSGPQLGGTEVTITGSNLGAERSDIQYVRIDGVNCTVIDYQPGVRYAELIHLRDCLSVED